MLFGVLIGGAVAAQNGVLDQQPKSPILTQVQEGQSHEAASQAIPVSQRGATLFSETFSAGFAGDNGIGAWEAYDSSPTGLEIWKEGGNGGEVPINFTFGNLTPNTTTSSNGYAFFDAFRFNQPTLPAYESVLGTLTSPSVDMSANGSVVLEYQHKFAYCCFSFSPLTVEVSNDGGFSWVVFPGEGAFIPDANVSSGNLTTQIDISCAAAFQSDVKVRFAYNNEFNPSFGFYSWCIDDVKLYETAAVNDLRISQVTNGDVFNLWEYRVTPIQQARTSGDGGLMVGVMYSNVGSDDQTNAVINVDILDDAGLTIFNYQSDAFDIPSGGNSLVCPYLGDTLYMDTEWQPSTVGDYSISVTITSDQTDASPIDNNSVRTIEYNNHTYGHDNPAQWTIEYRPDAGTTAGTFDRFGFGNVYTVPYEGSTANGIMVAFGPNTDVEFEVEVRLYELDNLGDINPIADAGPGSAGALYEIQIGDVSPSLSNPTYTWIEFEDAWDLLPDKFYFACVIQDAESSSSEMTCIGEPNSDTDFSTRIVALTGSQESYWFGDAGTPVVRLTMDSDLTGLTEVLVLEGLTLGQNMPNPASDMTTIQYQLEKGMNLSFHVLDANGRLVYHKNLGNMSAGQHSIDLDLAKFSTGVYQYSLSTGNSKVTKSMVVGK